MTKLEFMRALEEQLLVLPYQERLDALEYYDEYFDDAGIENEQQVAEQLVSPEAVAAKILGKSTSSQRQQPPPSYTAQEPRRHNRGVPLWVMLALSPILIPLAFAALMVILSLLITLVAFAVSFVVMAVALIVMTVICLVVGVPLLIMDPLNGMYVLGCALASCGIGVMFLPLCGWLFKKCVPACARGIGKFTQAVVRMFVPREAEREW